MPAVEIERTPNRVSKLNPPQLERHLVGSARALRVNKLRLSRTAKGQYSATRHVQPEIR
jgi:hypothetical protein